jgi:hypothetical protein
MSAPDFSQELEISLMDEYHVPVLYSTRQIHREVHSSVRSVPCDKLHEVRLVDCHPTRKKRFYLLTVAVHAKHFVAVIREASTCNKPYITGTDYCDI